MKKSSIPLLIAALLMPYIFLAAEVGMQSYGFHIFAFMVFFQIISVIFNCFTSKKLVLYIILSANLLLCTVVSYFVLFKYYSEYMKSNYEPWLNSEFLLEFGCVNAVFLSAAVFLFVRIIKKQINYEKRMYSSPSTFDNKQSTAFSIISFVSVMFSFLSVFFIIFLIDYCSINDYSLFTTAQYAMEIEYRLTLTLLWLILNVICTLTLGVLFSFISKPKGKTSVVLSLNARLIAFSLIISFGISGLLNSVIINRYIDIPIQNSNFLL